MLVLVVLGDGKLIIPVDFAIRCPNPKGPGQRCQDKLQLTQKMLDARLAAFAKRGVTLPPPMVVADSWFSDWPRSSDRPLYMLVTSVIGERPQDNLFKIDTLIFFDILSYVFISH